MSPARPVAFRVLSRVEDGGHASDLLLREAARIDSRDAGLAGQIVFGCLRYQAQLDYLIDYLSGRLQERLDREVRIALRMGIYQLRYLERIPPHAAVGDSVELVKRARKASAAGFVNAVLRKVHRDPLPWPSRAVELSMPPWLLERWDRTYGEETAAAIARAALREPDTYVRIPNGVPHDLDVEPAGIPGCYRLISSHATGLRRQDIGSQSIVPLLDLRPGLMFLDLCAAPGNKTAQALEAGVRAVACDRSWLRLKMLDGLPVDRLALDGTRPLPFSRRFDRILVDAPCSGTGTLARNPEIKWRLREADLAAHRRRQRMLVENALASLAPGGKLVYSTCSLEPEENQQVVDGLAVSRIHQRIPGDVPGDGFWAAVIPSI